jgi:hypothetical protein
MHKRRLIMEIYQIKSVIDTFGKQFNIDQCGEECCELVDAIQNALNDVIIDDGKTVIIQKVVINFNSVMGGGASLRVSN